MAKLSNEWKQSLSTDKASPFCEVVSLYDLWIARDFFLEHSVLSSETPYVEIAEIDSRFKPTYWTEQTVPFECDFKGILKRLGVPSPSEGDYFYEKGQGIKIYSKEAALLFSDTDSFKEGFPLALTQSDKRFIERYGVESAFQSVSFNGREDALNALFTKYWALPKECDLIEDGYISSEGIDPLIAEMLRHTWICVLAYFYADIIDYRDFGQRLTPDAEVVHRNLIISSKGDHRRYDLYSDDDKVDTAKTTRPYIPTTTPLINDNRTPSDVYLHASEFGSLQTESLENRQDGRPFFTPAAAGSIPFYFDPASRSEPEDYIDAPITVPKDGNILLDGRLFSVTIDELWEAIKRIAYGSKPVDPDDELEDVGYPKTGVESDTRPLPARQYKFDGHIGDPLHVTYEDDPSGRLKYHVDNWVEGKPIEILVKPLEELVSLLATIDEGQAKQVFDAVKGATPSDRPLSLRELESVLKGVQYNLSLLASYERLHSVQRSQFYQLHSEQLKFEGRDQLASIEDGDFKKRVYLSAAGTWQSVEQTFRLRVRDDEEF